MKKFYLILLLVFVASFSHAQNFTKVWAKFCNAVDFPWFNTTTPNGPGAFGNSTTGIAYNPVTNKVLVANRQDSIYILNAATGAQEGTLPLGGDIGPEAFKFNKIRCTSDGVIYAISLATGATTNARIYRWANQTTSPVLCANFAVTERCGDAFGLSGTGTNTVLYAAGSQFVNNGTSNVKVYVFTTINGVNFLNTSTIDIASGTSHWVNRAVDPVGATPSAGIWTDMSGGPARRFAVTGTAPTLTATTPAAYTTITGYNPGQAADAYGGMRYLQTPGNRRYLAFAGANNAGDGVTMRMLDVTNEADVKTVGTDTLYSGPSTLWTFQTNTNGTGDIAFKANGNGSYDIFYVATNNAIACVRTAITLPVELTNFSALLQKNNVKLNWSTANEINNSGFEVEKSIDGERFKSIGFTKAMGNATNNYEFIDANAATGKALKLFYRLKQVDKDGAFTYSKVEVVNLPIEKAYTISTFENPIKNEIRLIVGANKEANLTITVANANGQIVSTKNIVAKQGNNTVLLPAANLAKGLYYITGTDGVTKQTLSVMKN